MYLVIYAFHLKYLLPVQIRLHVLSYSVYKNLEIHLHHLVHLDRLDLGRAPLPYPLEAVVDALAARFGEGEA